MKAGWFRQAKSVFARPEPMPQVYAVPCDCGTTVQGERAERSQKTSCPTCGQSVFVMPACTYPIPTSIRKRWLGEDPVVAPSRTKSKPGRKRQKADRASPIVPSKPQSASWAERRQGLAAAARAQITPLRMIGVAIALSMVMISYVIYRQARWSHAQSTVQAAIDSGTQAIVDQDFAQAAASLTQATTALDILGRNDDTAHKIRRLALEATVCAGLSADSLPTLLAELFKEHGDDVIATRFDRRFAGQWILFDAPLYLEPGGRKSESGPWFDLPLLVDDEQVELRLDGNPWPALLSGSTAASPKRVIFAAQLDRLEPPTKDRETVRVWLRSDTAVLWSESETLEALGFMPTDADQLTVMQSILTAQRDLLKVRE